MRNVCGIPIKNQIEIAYQQGLDGSVSVLFAATVDSDRNDQLLAQTVLWIERTDREDQLLGIFSEHQWLAAAEEIVTNDQ